MVDNKTGDRMLWLRWGRRTMLTGRTCLSHTKQLIKVRSPFDRGMLNGAELTADS
jgi:hypothetical protein